MVWNPTMRRSLSVERLETKSLPSRSPPITPNWYVFVYAVRQLQIPSLFEDTMSALNPSTGIAYNQTSHVRSHVAEGASLLMPRQTDPFHTEKC